MKYNNAPIREAIFDIRINKLENYRIEDLEVAYSLISKQYPNKKKFLNFIGKIEFKNNIKISNEPNPKVNGLIFSNKTNNRKVQFRLDGFTFNMLSPYTEWNDFSEEALRLWEIYEKNLKPKNISRIALRYINIINIPLPIDKFKDYIVNIPPIPNSLPQTFRNFFMQIDVPCDNNGTNIIMTETIEKPINNKLPFILDIDVYKRENLNRNIETLRKEFNSLRKLKNITFESCITENTKGLFK